MKHDYMHCDNIKCQHTESCQRSTLHPSFTPKGAKWYSKFAPDPKTGVCKFYWPNEETEVKTMTETIKVPSVNTLESLVPPVDLCSKIPDGIFADSALIWCYDGDFWHVEARATSFYNKEEDIRPAPTLQEILAELHNYHLKKFGKDSPSDITVKRDPENFSPYFANHSPVVAALKLYLNLSYDPSVMSDPSDKSDRSTPEAQP